MPAATIIAALAVSGCALLLDHAARDCGRGVVDDARCQQMLDATEHLVPSAETVRVVIQFFSQVEGEERFGIDAIDPDGAIHVVTCTYRGGRFDGCAAGEILAPSS